MPGGRPKSDVKARFLAKVKRMPSGCLEWQSVLHRDGYGKFYNDGRQIQAHRISYQLFVGPIPKGKWVLHKCDNRKCVEPTHLFLGDMILNIRDMDQKGRRGSKSVLTESQAEAIKKLLLAGRTQQSIADEFGIHQTAVSRIKRLKTFRFRKE
jgi:hypothetical protein